VAEGVTGTGGVLREVAANGVATITLDRADKRNALDDRLIDELVQAVEDLGRDPAARVLVLRGSGPSFCSGADTSPIGAGGGPVAALDDRDHMLDHRFGRFLALWDAPKPVIAEVHGHCLGIAVALCSCADLVIVAEDATIGWPLPLGGGVIGPTFALHVGARRAKELSFLPMSTLTGAEAAELGWANRAVPAGDLRAAVTEVADQIARVPAGVLRVKKEAINAVFDRLGFREALRDAASRNALAHTDPEIEPLRQRVRTDGIKAVARWFRELAP
jgi:enoyl-CoA hydratase